MALDCQNVDSTLVSVAALFSIGKQELRTALTNLSFSALEESLRNSLKPPDRMLWDRFPGAGTPSPVPAMIYSFRATRVPPGTDFRDGSQPLGNRLPAFGSDGTGRLAQRVNVSALRDSERGRSSRRRQALGSDECSRTKQGERQ